MADSRRKKIKCKMKLEHLVVPERKEVLKKQKDGSMSRDAGVTLKEFPMARAGTI